MRKFVFFIVPGLVMFTLGGLWNSVLLAKFFAGHAPIIARPPAEVRLGIIVAAYGLLTAFMAFLFTQSFPQKPGSLAGFQFGSLFGVIMTLPVYLLLYAVWNVSLSALLVDVLWHGLEQGVGGILMAALLVPKVSPAFSSP
jgi:hypothetical protein